MSELGTNILHRRPLNEISRNLHMDAGERTGSAGQKYNVAGKTA